MESNEVEILKSLTIRFWLAASLLVFFVISVTSVISILFLHIYFVILIEAIIILLLALFLYKLYQRNKWMKFVISDERFTVSKPKKIKCEVYWSEFDIMKLKVLGTEYGSLKPRNMQRRVNVFKIKLLRSGSNEIIKSEKFAWVNKKEARRIMELIRGYATRRGKEVILKTRDMS